MDVLYNISKIHRIPTNGQRDVVENINNIQSGKMLKVSWMFTVQRISTSKSAQNFKSFFVKAWKFPGLEDTYADVENPTPNENSTAFLLEG
jgi:hypothetical protein